MFGYFNDVIVVRIVHWCLKRSSQHVQYYCLSSLAARVRQCRQRTDDTRNDWVGLVVCLANCAKPAQCKFVERDHESAVHAERQSVLRKHAHSSFEQTLTLDEREQQCETEFDDESFGCRLCKAEHTVKESTEVIAEDWADWVEEVRLYWMFSLMRFFEYYNFYDSFYIIFPIISIFLIIWNSILYFFMFHFILKQ